MNLKTITAIAVAAVLTGCASIDDAANARQALIQKVQDTTPECTTEPQCDAMWGAAQIWIVKNAGYKLQAATDVVIETYSPSDSSTALRVRALKEPSENGKVITASVWCGNIFGCDRNPLKATLDFNEYVSSSAAGL